MEGYLVGRHRLEVALEEGPGVDLVEQPLVLVRGRGEGDHGPHLCYILRVG